jgi:alpha-tubulin suppressor-like RCC1 family protein
MPVSAARSISFLLCLAATACTASATAPGGGDCGDGADAAACDDGNPCTDDSCGTTGTCAHADNNASCDDGMFCNGADTCGGGVCGHAGDPCVGGGECADACDELAGNCYADAGDPCTDDGNVCTDNVCGAAGTCDPVSNTAECDDGVFCNGADTCDGGVCGHAGDPCATGDCDEPAGTCDGGGIVFVSVVTGMYHSCGLSDDGVAYCWGADDLGGLGDGGTAASTFSPSPVDTSTMSGATAFVTLGAGVYHTCGLTGEGVAYCWGWGEFGQIGDGGAAAEVQSPTAVDTSTISGAKIFTQLVAGGGHNCGLTTEGVAYCWGWDEYGQVGSGSAAPSRLRPTAVDTSTISGAKTFAQLIAGNAHSCGITTDGVAYCWGDDDFGQIGDGGPFTDVDALRPVAVNTSTMTGSTEFASLAKGANHTCGLTVTGVAYCWGFDLRGALGDGTATDDPFEPAKTSPSPVDTSTMTGSTVFVQLEGAHTHTCGVAADGVAYCWGDDSSGQLGDGGSWQDTQSPSAIDVTGIDGATTFERLDGGEMHSCGLTTDGAIYCWGSDGQGQLGDGGTAQDTFSPSAIDVDGIP